MPDTIAEADGRLQMEGLRQLQTGESYQWRGSVSPVPGTSWFHVLVEIDSGGFPIALAGPPEPELKLDLGALPAYERGDHVWWKTLVENPAQWNNEARGNDFPATYYFDPALKTEFFLFFDMTAMSWMGRESLTRFYDYKSGFRRRIEGVPTAELGLLAQTQSGNLFPEGRQHLSWYVAANYLADEPAPPTEQEAVPRLVEMCLPLTRSSEGHWPTNATSWASFAENCAIDLMSDEHAWGIDDLGEYLLNYVDGRSDAWEKAFAARGKTYNRREVCLEAAIWALRPLDVLQAWIPDAPYRELVERLEGFVRRELLAPRSQMLTGLAEQTTMLGTWQYLYKLSDAWFIYSARDDAEMTARIVAEVEQVVLPLAAHTQYLFPLQFDKKSLGKLGPGNNVAVCGLYALFMAELARALDSGFYLEEARRALRTLANVSIDDALQEVFLIAQAVDAAARLHRLTGEIEWKQLNEYFRAQTLRMMYWYDDLTSARTAGADHLGMFLACANINYPAFFENIEVDARLAGALSFDPRPGELLKVIDYGRRNNFSFFPECSPELFGPMPLDYIPFEQVPILDGPLDVDFVGQEIYGAGWTFRAHLLWDAYARSSDREVMIVNMDSYREPDCGPWSGSFYVFNSTGEDRETRLSFPVIPDGQEGVVTLHLDDGSTRALTAGRSETMPLTVPGAGWLRVDLAVSERPPVHR